MTFIFRICYQEKPRQAVSIAAWIKLDTNKGFHSIFDTVGGHSDHKSGQYHFEVQDGSVRWFHRNESGDEIFSVETGTCKNMHKIKGKRKIIQSKCMSGQPGFSRVPDKTHKVFLTVWAGVWIVLHHGPQPAGLFKLL